MEEINGKKVFFPADVRQIIEAENRKYPNSLRDKIFRFLVGLREKMEKKQGEAIAKTLAKSIKKS
jgi:hypothetical protein